MQMTKTATKDDPTRIEQQKKYDAALAEARKLTEAAAEAHFNVDRPRRELLARLRSRANISGGSRGGEILRGFLLRRRVSDLQTARDAARARFRSAVDELHFAFVDLAALDHVLANGNPIFGGERLQTLGAPPDYWSLVHPVYAPHKPANWNTEIEALRERYLAAALAEPEAPPPLVVHERK
jgi:hypothetical protein